MMNHRWKADMNEETLTEACDRYGIKVESAKLIRSNSNYIYDCGDKFLRLTHANIRDEKAIQSELAWIDYLRKSDLSVVEIINSSIGHQFEVIGSENQVIIVCFQKIEGKKISKEKWDENHFRNLGILLGKLHKLSRAYKIGEGLTYHHWNEIVEHKMVDHLPKDDRRLDKLYQDLVAEIETYDRHKTNYGVVHYDIHQGNYLLSGNDIVLFDFEITCKSWFMSDAATVLYYALQTKRGSREKEFEEVFMKYFWEGYETITQIEEKEKSYIPRFLLYRDLMVYGYIHKVWKFDMLNENQKDYVKKIEESIKARRLKFEQK